MRGAEQIKYAPMPVDLHSHILPGMDDGSQSVEQTLAMLQEAARQGVTEMVATPHFYPEQESPTSFLARRREAVKQLLAGGYDPARHPRIYLGAEVAYFYGIGRSAELGRLCIEGTRAVLIEMPDDAWTAGIWEDIELVRARSALRPIIAHIERCKTMHNAAARRAMLDCGALLQISAGLAEHPTKRQWALRLLMRGEAQFLGSDCHNMTERAPNMGRMAEYLMNKKRTALLEQLAEGASQLLTNARPIG